MLKIEDLKTDEKFERLTPASKEEFKALEKMIVADGELHSPIIVWQGQNIVVDGHSCLEILKKHPELPYTIKEIPFEDWQEVIVWIVEHHIARKSFTLWKRLEMALNCEEYWKSKEEAKRNQGTRNDLTAPGAEKSEPINTNLILAEKVGCGETTVIQFKKVFKEASEDIKQRCKDGDMSITRAHTNLTKKKSPKKTSPKTKPELSIEVEKINILAECEKNQTVSGGGNINIPDPTPIAEQMGKPNIPDEVVWFAINPIEQMIQIFMKKHDSDKGKNHIHVNSFSFKTVSTEDGVSILEVQHIGGATEEFAQKDEKGFDSEQKKASSNRTGK